MEPRNMGIVDRASLHQAVPDLKTEGNPNAWVCLSKASSQAHGWKRSTKALEIVGAGCLVQVSSTQRNPDGTYTMADALQWLPGVSLDALRRATAAPLMGTTLAPECDMDPLELAYWEFDHLHKMRDGMSERDAFKCAVRPLLRPSPK